MKQELMQLPRELLQECVDPDSVGCRADQASIEAIVDHLTRSHVTFHGAERPSIPSITRYGFAIQGAPIGDSGKTLYGRLHFTYYGFGIYSTPDFEEATIYAVEHVGVYPGSGWHHPSRLPGARIIVCATLMGLSLEVKQDEVENAKDVDHSHANSHVSPNGHEYVLFDPAQIVPLYVVYFNEGPEATREQSQSCSRYVNRYQPEPPVEAEDSTLETTAAKRKELKARAMKQLPYGSGAAAGTSFIVEAVAEVVEDDDADGEYQPLRCEQQPEILERQKKFAGESTSWFDEY